MLSPPNRAAVAEIVRLGGHVADFEILATLGRGGMATVWLGRAVRTGGFARLVAVKTVHPELSVDPAIRQLFLREARIASAIHHANVIDVFDVGEANGVLYQVMSLVEGSDLRTLTDRSPELLPAGVLLTIVVDALRGLHAAHQSVSADGREQHVVHRDVSPQNILVGLDGVARVSDFGIARSLPYVDETTASLRGKVAYLSPEQATRGPVDRRTDVFAMGILLWEGLTGVRLFRGRDALECIELVRHKPVSHPTDIRRSVARALGDVALRALVRDPEGRFTTAAAMADALLDAARATDIVLDNGEVARFVDAQMGAEIRERIRGAGTSRSGPPVDRNSARGEATTTYVTGHPSMAPEPEESVRLSPVAPVRAETSTSFVPTAAAQDVASSGSASRAQAQSPWRLSAGGWLGVIGATLGAAALALSAVRAPRGGRGDALVHPARTESMIAASTVLAAAPPPLEAGARTLPQADADAPAVEASASVPAPSKTAHSRPANEKRSPPRQRVDPPFARNPFRQ